jgi:branched-chain amino acid transport system substrate-binding protein
LRESGLRQALNSFARCLKTTNTNKRIGVSTITAAALLIIGLIIGAGAVYGLGLSSAAPSTTTSTVTGPGTTITQAGSTVTVTTGAAGTGTVTVTTTASSTGAACGTCLEGINNTLLLGAANAAGNLTGTFTIGDLQDLTDGLAGQGLDDQVTSNLAIQDINAWINTPGNPLKGHVTFAQNLQDYKEDNTLTGTLMNSYLSQGIHVVVGPLNSGTAGAMLPFANSHQIVMISPSSTNPNIALPGDYLFRTPPTDKLQGIVDAYEFKQSGVQDVVILYRNDGYGAGLANSTAANFKAIGGQVEAQIPYDVTSSNFVAVLGQLNDAYNSAVGKVGASHVGLYFITFDELGQIATQTAANYPNLLKTTLPWFGTDGNGDEAPIVNSTYSATTVLTRLTSSFPGYSASPLAQHVCAYQLAQRSTLCDGYTLGTYDDMWLAALAILYCAPSEGYKAVQNGACMQQVLPAIAANFPGATGVTILNAAGDRLLPSYQFFCIVPGSTSGSAKWITCGTWNEGTLSVVWTAKPSGIP